MNIYLLELTKEFDDSINWYDTYDGHVVAAKNPAAARKKCPSGDEGAAWVNPEKSSCVLIAKDVASEEKVILSSFRAA